MFLYQTQHKQLSETKGGYMGDVMNLNITARSEHDGQIQVRLGIIDYIGQVEVYSDHTMNAIHAGEALTWLRSLHGLVINTPQNFAETIKKPLWEVTIAKPVAEISRGLAKFAEMP